MRRGWLAMTCVVAGCTGLFGPETSDQEGAPVVSPEPPAAAPPSPAPQAGVLRPQREPPEPNAPPWTQAEVALVDREGQRVLRVVGLVKDIQNPALARQTAEARARVTLAKWLGVTNLSGGQIVDHWESANGSYALAEVVVDAAWQPNPSLTQEN